jgi:hypothetical protein
MAYPIVSAPYGIKPVNLIGGQVFAGSTRNLPIAYNYGTAIYYGDPVQLTAGYIVIAPGGASLTGASYLKGTVGIFLGCYYTNPTTKQRQYAQYYPGNVLAGDITAIVADDPDQVFQVAVTNSASGTTISSIPQGMVGNNLAGNTLTGSASTGNSSAAVIASATTTAIGSGGVWRIIQLIPDTQISTSATYVSGATTTSLVVSGLSVGQVIPVGTDIFQLVNGQLQSIVSVVTTAATVTTTGSTTLTVTASSVTPSASATLVLIQTPEVLVKFNQGVHDYYSA